jgi:hypothetical protein
MTKAQYVDTRLSPWLTVQQQYRRQNRTRQSSTARVTVRNVRVIFRRAAGGPDQDGDGHGACPISMAAQRSTIGSIPSFDAE